MNELKKFDIDIAKLIPGQHEFRYLIDDKFFELFDYRLVDRGKLEVELLIDKKTTFLTLRFGILGSIELTCDRSLDPFDYHVSTNKEIVLKYGEEAKEVSDDVEIIPYKTQWINVARYIYELVSVEIPMKKLHPRYKDESPEDQMIYSSSDEEEDQQMDPRWKELKKLKNKDNN